MSEEQVRKIDYNNNQDRLNLENQLNGARNANLKEAQHICHVALAKHLQDVGDYSNSLRN